LFFIESTPLSLSMGLLACLEPRHHRLAIPNTPPELVSPTSSSHSFRPFPFEDQSRIPPPLPSPPMSNYDQRSVAEMSVGKAVDEGLQRTDAAAPPGPRAQLPSITSLFGPSSALRPLHSPISDRPASYPATSPLDRPHVSSAQTDRSFSSTSYFSQGPPATQPRSIYDPKFDSERPPIHALTRSFSGPGSPAITNLEHHRQDSRSDHGSTGSRWSLHQERHEYALGSRDSTSLRSPLERLPIPRISQGPNPPPTPTSTVISEGVPAKDGLGPKIWTGTHFLPRFVRAAEVPGEGMCYFYDDGSHCKTVIDGEAVNAHWGVTKAGKPRKRLAIACVTCREKKIKCDPDYPRCVQCEKFGRICRFKNA
jgi:Fungal Zn(2)-Cys(6) binuclear cluster domain